MLGRADGWVHLGFVAEPGVAFGGDEPEVLGGDFAGDGEPFFLGFGDEGEFVGGGDVENVDGSTGLFGEADELFGRDFRAFGVAEEGVFDGGRFA